MFSCIIHAEKKREVAVIDISNAFIHKRVENENEMSVINIIRVIVNLIFKIYPELYGIIVTNDKTGEKVIIVQCTNIIYGTMVASLLYYKKFVNTLRST